MKRLKKKAKIKKGVGAPLPPLQKKAGLGLDCELACSKAGF